MSLLVEGTLPDVQAGDDERGVALDEVGISGLRYPATIECADGSLQQTICEAQLAVALAAPTRGTHMSRFVEALHEQRGTLSPVSILATARGLAARLDADEAAIRFAFPLFLSRKAPVTRQEALLGIDCTLTARSRTNGAGEVRIGARVPVTSLCPCSKEIADYSAHSQRGHVLIEVLDGRWPIGAPGLWPEELLTVCDQAASAPIYPLLKRPDERHVTMLAYDRPAFVEDLARDVALALKADERVDGFDLEVVNQESIHDHQAFARLEWRRL
ncbi:MAG TPA: GTP cyclohydrolase FolE2 [Solirubrobacteraceae bacterium]|jgi:GTP cyclohydrolase I|nr:GTP cyclohydrolase FolE2 [Solirubrobacteraceae bacterium]